MALHCPFVNCTGVVDAISYSITSITKAGQKQIPYKETLREILIFKWKGLYKE